MELFLSLAVPSCQNSDTEKQTLEKATFLNTYTYSP